MNFLNIDTMIMMTSVSSLLQSIVLVSLWYSANQYKGISIYVLGNIFSCLSFVGFLLRNIFSLPLEVRLVNNLIFVSAILLHSIGIGQFLSRKINYRAWLWCFFAISVFSSLFGVLF